MIISQRTIQIVNKARWFKVAMDAEVEQAQYDLINDLRILADIPDEGQNQ